MSILRRLSAIAAGAAAVVVLLAAPAPDAEAKGDVFVEHGGHRRKCLPQRPQRFLVRSHYVVGGSLWPKRHEKAVRYRTEQYGYVEGFGSPDWNDHPPSFYAKDTTFFGHHLSVHEKVVPALACVEKWVEHSCKKHPYEPKAVSGFRDRNTYRGGEITNHLYGIAIDIDPDRNPCCKCVEPWSSDPLCEKKTKSPYDRAALPACWIDGFERYGFYWLGNDELEDTMHFEFLGKPDKILK